MEISETEKLPLTCHTGGPFPSHHMVFHIPEKIFTKSIILFFRFSLEVTWKFTVGMMISQIILTMVRSGGELLFGVFK